MNEETNALRRFMYFTTATAEAIAVLWALILFASAFTVNVLQAIPILFVALFGLVAAIFLELVRQRLK